MGVVLAEPDLHRESVKAAGDGCGGGLVAVHTFPSDTLLIRLDPGVRRHRLVLSPSRPKGRTPSL